MCKHVWAKIFLEALLVEAKYYNQLTTWNWKSVECSEAIKRAESSGLARHNTIGYTWVKKSNLGKFEDSMI